MSKYFTKYKHGRKRKVTHSRRGLSDTILNGKVKRQSKYITYS